MLPSSPDALTLLFSYSANVQKHYFVDTFLWEVFVFADWSTSSVTPHKFHIATGGDFANGQPRYNMCAQIWSNKPRPSSKRDLSAPVTIATDKRGMIFECKQILQLASGGYIFTLTPTLTRTVLIVI